MSNILTDLWKREQIWTPFDVQSGFPAWRQEVKEIYNETFILDSHFLIFNWSKYQSGITFRYIHENDNIYKKDLTVSDSSNYLTNYFSPYDVINNYYNNIHPIDVACDFNVFTSQNYYKLDSVRLKPGNRILLFGNNNKRQNGIYVVNNKYFLIRSDELSTQDKVFRYQVYCLFGTYANNHFYLQPDSNGRFPQDGDLITFNNDRGIILKSTVNYDIYSTGSTSKIVFTDVDIARKQLTVNSDYYGGILFSGNTVIDLTPLTIIYKDVLYPIAKTSTISYEEKYFTTDFNVYNFNGETHIKLGETNMPYDIYDYINFKIFYNDIKNPFVDKNYLNLNTFIKEVKGTTIVISDIIPNHIVDIIGADFDGYVINRISGETLLDTEIIYEDKFVTDLGWNLTNYFNLNNDYLNLTISGSTGITSQASQKLWQNIISGETYKFTFIIVDNDTNNSFTGKSYLSGTTGLQELFNFYPNYTGTTTYSHIFVADNDYTNLLLEFYSQNINNISFNSIKLEQIVNTYEIDSGLTLYYNMNKLDYYVSSSTLFFSEDFSNVQTSTGNTSGDTSGTTWNIDEYVIISGGTLIVLSGSSEQQHANTFTGSLFEANINLKFECSYTGDTSASVYLMGSTYAQKITDFTGTTDISNIHISGNTNYIVYIFPSGITGASINNIELDLNYEITYPNIIKDEINNITATGNSLVLNDEGIVNSSFTYNSYNSYMKLKNNIIGSGTTKSISLWFKTNKYGTILGYQNSSIGNKPTSYCPMIYVGLDGKLRCQANNGLIKPITSGKLVNDSIYHNVILILENNIQTVYLDSQLIGQLTGTINHSNLIFNQIGVGFCRNWEQTNNGWFYFNGFIDEFGHWNKVLSKKEIDFIYNTRKGSTYFFTPQKIISDINKYSYSVRNLNYTDDLLIDFTSAIDDSYLNDFIKTDIEFLGTNSAITTNNILTSLDDTYGIPIYYFKFSKSGDFGDFGNSGYNSFGDFGFLGFTSWNNNNIIFTGVTTGVSIGEYYSNTFVVSKGESFLFNANITELSIDGDSFLTPYFESDNLNISTGYTLNLMSGYTNSSLYTPPNLGLISYYDFDNNENKVWKQLGTPTYSGTTIINTGITITNGLVGSGYSFDGFSSNSRFDMTIQDPMTISIWFKSDTTGILLSHQNNTGNTIPDEYVPLIYIGIDGKLRSGFGDNIDHIEGPSVIDNLWHNAILTLNINTQILYLDGNLIDSGSVTPKSGLTYSILGTGYGNGYSGILSINYFNYQGIIDEFSIFNKVLDINQVSTIYNNKFGSTFESDNEILVYFLSEFSPQQNTTEIVKSENFSVKENFWYKLEFTPFDVKNISQIQISLVDESGNTNSIVVDENDNFISTKYQSSVSVEFLEGKSTEIIFQATNSGVSYIQFEIIPFNTLTSKNFNSYMKFYQYDNIQLIVNIRNSDKKIISNSITIDKLGLTSEILKINEDLDISLIDAFLFTIFNPNGTPTSLKTAIGYFELFRIIENFRLSIQPKYSAENRYFYYDEFAILVESSNFILTENKFPLIYPYLEDNVLILTETSIVGSGESALLREVGGITEEEKVKFSVFNSYINYELYPFLNGLCSDFTEDYKIYNSSEIIFYDTYTWKYFDNTHSMIIITPNNPTQLRFFEPFTYIKYNGGVYSLILEVSDTYMIVENGYNFESMTSIDSSFRNVTTLKEISDILNDNYMGHSLFINVKNIETSKKISDAYGDIISEDKLIQNCTSGIIYGDTNNKYIFKIFDIEDKKLEYNPVEISVIGIDKKYRFPINLEKDNFI